MHGGIDQWPRTAVAGGACPVGRSDILHGFPGIGVAGRKRDSALYVGVEDPDTGAMDIERTRELFEALAIRMNGHTASSVEPRYENPNIPSGYTYLAQFAAHDLSVNSEDRAELGKTVNARNMRSLPLALNALYASGPSISSFCYQHAPSFSPDFARLRLERVGKENGKAPRRDIGRLCEYEAALPRSRPLTADARSDDNAMISQLTALLSMAHNAAVDVSARIRPDDTPFAHYKRARLATTLAYRSILRNDLLRRLLDREVFAWYNRSNDPGRFLTEMEDGSPVTREFAHAAFRIGHSMVRPFYKFNDHSETHPIQRVLTRTSELDPQEVPLDRCWIAQWSRFFDIPGATAPGMLQRGMKIGPGYGSALNAHFKRPYESVGSGLAMRDLMRSAVSGVRKLDSLRTGITRAAPSDFPHRGWLRDGAAHRELLEGWARRATPSGGFGGVFPPAMSDAQIEAFASNPPLVLFVTLEAAAKPWHGERLGPIGSIILAETFFRALDDDAALDFLAASEDEAGEEAVDMVYGTSVPSTMPDLVLWLDRNVSASEKVLPDGQAIPII
ncbi:peroxidase family protein [Mesorhizobium sp. CAU 1732]|uniref:peroxidase family protein n=1 Tax=Mesorhizobium sp. CAU 1732 TaxID=3140358 RepID=UPI003260F96F